MKKSNKLLLAGFLTALLLLTVIHVTLYAKYKARDYIIYNPEDDLATQAMQSFPNILFVSVRNVPGAIVQFSDVAKTAQGQESDIQYVQKGDTLLITGRDGAQQGDFDQPASFHLPYNTTLSLFNSSLSFELGKKNAENNPVIYLKKSSAKFSGTKSSFQLGHVRIVASDSSTTAFYGNTHINHLDVQLSNSEIKTRECEFGQLSILTDSLSHISLQSKHLLKATIKNIAPQ